MDNWIIFSKFGILIYCCIRYVQGGMKNEGEVVFSILTYIFLNMLYYVLKNKNFKNIIMMMSAVLLVYCSVRFNVLFILLLPANIIELTYGFIPDIRAAMLAALFPVLFLYNIILPEYVLICFLSFIIYLLSNKSYNRITNLLKENNELRERIDMLYTRIDRGEEYQRQLKYLSQLEERNSIAQQIHDRVGHAISGSLIQLEAAVLLVEKDKARTQDIIRNVIGVLRNGMENIRATLRNIKPPVEQIGINRIKTMLDEFSVNHGIKTNLLYKGSVENISQLYWKIINENITETLTNALKYSKCTSIGVNIEVLNKLVKCEVRDNGIGAQACKKGLGIKGIEERCTNVGGKVIIDGSNGFSIITLLPLEEVRNVH